MLTSAELRVSMSGASLVTVSVSCTCEIDSLPSTGSD